jgi:hypothetical protein
MTEETKDETQPDTHDGDADQPATSTTAGWAFRGAVVGAATGAAVGAGIGAVLAARPDLLDSAKETVGGAGRDVAKSAAVAVGQVLTTRSVANLVSNGDADRADVVKQTAKEAATAAAGAARDTLVSMQAGSAKS